MSQRPSDASCGTTASPISSCRARALWGLDSMTTTSWRAVEEVTRELTAHLASRRR